MKTDHVSRSCLRELPTWLHASVRLKYVLVNSFTNRHPHLRMANRCSSSTTVKMLPETDYTPRCQLHSHQVQVRQQHPRVLSADETACSEQEQPTLQALPIEEKSRRLALITYACSSIRVALISARAAQLFQQSTTILRHAQVI